MIHSFPGWKMKDICHTHLFDKIHLHLSQLVLGKGLEDNEVVGKNVSFSVLTHKPKVCVDAIFVYDFYNIAKHISVHIVLSA